MKGATCNLTQCVGLLDYAYLSLNVYHKKEDDKYLGSRPKAIYDISRLKNYMNSERGWIQIAFPQLRMLLDFSFCAELYAKVYNGKIHHLMIAIRGTDKLPDDVEDILTWWNTVFPGAEYYSQSVPHYFDYVRTFVMHCVHVIAELDDHQLFAPYCGYHVTGHSLGGALANLVGASSMICQPPNLSEVIQFAPYVVSFNAPGIGGMTPYGSDAFNEGMVVSMRAEYDMVSALGKPYGYVINNIIPEGYAKAKKAFDIEGEIERGENLQQTLCNATASCELEGHAEQIPLMGGILSQHSMGNFMHMLCQHDSALSISFTQLKSWAQDHGGKNHQFASPALYSTQLASAA